MASSTPSGSSRAGPRQGHSATALGTVMTTMATADSQATGRQRRDGSRPSGNNKGTKVSSRPTLRDGVRSIPAGLGRVHGSSAADANTACMLTARMFRGERPGIVTDFGPSTCPAPGCGTASEISRHLATDH
jgi:hypothetical protein